MSHYREVLCKALQDFIQHVWYHGIVGRSGTRTVHTTYRYYVHRLIFDKLMLAWFWHGLKLAA